MTISIPTKVWLVLLVTFTCSLRGAQSTGRDFRESCEPKHIPTDIHLKGCPASREVLSTCVGMCETTDNKEEGKTNCKCCVPTRTRDITVHVTCKHQGSWGIVKHKIKEHEHCACSACE